MPSILSSRRSSNKNFNTEKVKKISNTDQAYDTVKLDVKEMNVNLNNSGLKDKLNPFEEKVNFPPEISTGRTPVKSR